MAAACQPHAVIVWPRMDWTALAPTRLELPLSEVEKQGQPEGDAHEKGGDDGPI